MICLSRTRWSMPFLSTTLNHLLPPAVFNASMTIACPPCVTAVENDAIFGTSFLCPVKSLNLYTATTGISFAGGKSNNSRYEGSLITSASSTQINGIALSKVLPIACA